MRDEGTKNHVVAILAIVTGLGMFALFSGCMTLEQMAPPVGDKFQLVAARHSVDVATLELGREVYLSDCVKCHSVEPIARYSERRWHKILPRMASESELNDQRRAALEAYVMWALALLDENAKTESETAGSRKAASGESIADTYATHGGG